jgi:hypothetical protein
MYDMKKRKLEHEQTHTVRDETGNIKQETTFRNYQVPIEDNFVKLYIKDLGRLIGISKTQCSVLLELLKSMSYNNLIPVYMPIKQKIVENTGLNINTINKSIQEFSDRGILIRKDRGLYIADPELFGKGRFRDIEKLRLTIDYDQDGKRINTERYDKMTKQLRMKETDTNRF